MLRKIFIVFIIAVFINYIIGCSVTSNKSVSAQELDVGSEKIVAVVLTNAEKISFDESGGKLISKKNFIEGISDNGENKFFGLNILNSLRWIDTLNSGKVYSGTPEEFSDYLKNTRQDNSSGLLISEVITRNGKTYIFNSEGGKYHKEKIYVLGNTIERKLVEIDNSEILYAVVEKIDYTGSVLASMGVVAGIILVVFVIALATKQSCPFVYSFDGEKYVFDAEPLGGATTKGLERTELSKLEHIKPVNDKYKILVKNEVPETQFIDEMSLIAIDHQINTEVYPDLDCNLYVLNSPQHVLKANDEFGNDISKFVNQDDSIFWQTKLPFDSTKFNYELRHKLTFAFPRPENIEYANLVINAGTSLWGSQMIREMQTLYGKGIDNWYDQIDNNDFAKSQMIQFIEREELYIMNALIKEDGQWISRASINGGGPFISETRKYSLDLTNTSGDTLYVRFNIPYGFWTLDYIAVDYTNPINPYSQEIKLTKATDHNDKNISALLSSQDENYCIMPEVGDYFYAEANAPATKETLKRTVFLKTGGYYKLHLKKDTDVQTQLLFNIASIPGMIVKYSMERYDDWVSSYSN